MEKFSARTITIFPFGRAEVNTMYMGQAGFGDWHGNCKEADHELYRHCKEMD